VITLKENQDDGPLLLERKFVGSWLRMFFLLILLAGGLYGIRTYRMVQEGQFASIHADDKHLLCNQIGTDSYSGVQRLDIATALFLSDEITSECLRKEADYSLWNTLESEKAWAYLAKAILSDDKMDQERYFTKACDWNKKEEACQLANYMAQDEDQVDGTIKIKKLASVTSRVLLLNDMIEKNNYLAAIMLVKDLQREAPLHGAMEKQYVRSVWSLHEGKRASSVLRQPASQEHENIIREFKEKYGVK
jgi:hypothetical protein